MTRSNGPSLLRWARIVFSPHADTVLRQMDPPARQRLAKIIAVIKTSPEDGAFYAELRDGTLLRQKTGADVHVIYAVAWWPVGRVLQVVLIEIQDWEPRDDALIGAGG